MSRDKKNILIDYLKSINFKNFSIQACDVSSEIDDQPLNESMVLIGANNRAANALKFSEAKCLSIGLEGGLTMVSGDDNYYLLCAAVIKDSMANSFVGLSGKLVLPQNISNLIREGKDFGTVIKEEAAKINDVYGYYEELISRRLSFKQAIHNSFLSYFNRR